MDTKASFVKAGTFPLSRYRNETSEVRDPKLLKV
jgi:hypothetical protein